MKALLQKLVDRLDLSPDEVEAAFETILQGEATPAQMGAFLVALRMKGETPAEIAAAAMVMRRRATPGPNAARSRGARHLRHRRRRRAGPSTSPPPRRSWSPGPESPSPSTGTGACPPGAAARISWPLAA